MPEITASEFLCALGDHRLLEPERLEVVQRKAKDTPVPARKLAEALVRQGWLTTYQAARLLDGRAAELVIGPYVLEEKLGEGGMGQVFRARHQKLDRLVALKVIKTELLNHPEAVRRFHREARAAAKLSHPNVVTVYDADEANGFHYYAMEFVEGTDLERLVVREGPLPPGQACIYVAQAANGLQHALEQGLVHRDIKPANLLLSSRGGLVKILDMGLARLQKSEERVAGQRLTRLGSVMGTPDYMAPEQVMDSRQVDIRADIYSLGCTLYFLLTGGPPFAEGSSQQKLAWHLAAEPPSLDSHRKDLPPGLEVVVGRMMAKKPEDRYATPAEVITALRPFCRAGSRTVAGSSNAGATAAGATVPPGLEPTVRGPAEVPAPVPEAPVPTVVAPRADSSFEQKTLMLPGRRARSVPSWIVWVGGAAGAVVLLGLLVFLIWPRGGGAADGGGAPVPDALTNDVGMKFVPIPAGRFDMGSHPTEAERQPDEGPVHGVRIPRGFLLGAYEVTQGQYERVVGKNPSDFRPDRGGSVDHPVESVSWEEAVEFCRLLGERPAERAAGRTYRLPTEAEWEYACRAGTLTPFAFGSSLSSLQACFRGDAPYGGAERGPVPKLTAKVGSYRPNAWGVYDMHGNVWEWCADGYEANAYAAGDRPDPSGPAGGDERVVRGGSWQDFGRDCRSAVRAHFPPGRRLYHVGFRVVCEGKPAAN